ncbi:MAG: Spo0E like sporulation regulatory protein [Firmicutes bacterium]|nr:Spo0E like sporulation regulatory protein [Bacillota bacterium]
MGQALKIEAMRIRLSALVAAKKFNMQDPEVLSLSKELDKLIVSFEKAKEVTLPREEYNVRLSL